MEEETLICGFGEKCFIMDISMEELCGYFCENLTEKDNKNYCKRFKKFVKTYISENERNHILGKTKC